MSDRGIPPRAARCLRRDYSNIEAVAAPTGGITRRGWLRGRGLAAAAVATASLERTASAADDADWKIMNGRIQQSVCHWCFEPMPLEELARAAAAMGIKSVEIVGPETWPTLKKHGLICAMTPSHGFVRGLNNKKYHPECIEKLTAAIDATGAAGFPNVITFSGHARRAERRGRDPEHDRRA